MKKIFLTLLFSLILIVSSFAQNTLIKVNGNDWLSFDENIKETFVAGFVTGYGSLYMLFSATSTPEEISNLATLLLFDDTTMEIVKKLDKFYSNIKNLKYPIWMVIMSTQSKGPKVGENVEGDITNNENK